MCRKLVLAATVLSLLAAPALAAKPPKAKVSGIARQAQSALRTRRERRTTSVTKPDYFFSSSVIPARSTVPTL